MNEERASAIPWRATLFGVGLAIVVIAAARLRWINLDAGSMWFDEQDVLRVCRVPIAKGFFRAIRFHVYAYPGDYLLVKPFLLLSGDPDLTLHLPAFMMGLAAVVVAGLLGRRLYGSVFGFALASAIAFSAIHIEYSQELRFYASLFFFSLLITLMSLDLWRKPTRRVLGAGTALTILGYQFHLMISMSVMIFFTAAVLSFASRKIKKTEPRPESYQLKSLLLAAAALLVFCFPVTWMYFLAPNHELHFESTGEGLHLFWNTFTKDYFNLERASLILFFTKPYLLPISKSLSIVFCIVSSIYALARRRELMIPTFYGLAYTVALFLAVRRSNQYLEPRHYLFIDPVILIVLCAGANEFIQAIRRGVHDFLSSDAKTGKSYLLAAATAAFALIYLSGAIFYARDFIRTGIGFARMDNLQTLRSNPRRAIEFIMNNSTDEKIYAIMEDKVMARAQINYFDLLGYPKERIKVGDAESIERELKGESSFWLLGNLPQRYRVKGHYLAFAHGAMAQPIYFYRRNSFLTLKDLQEIDWIAQDAGIIYSYFELARNYLDPQDLLNLSTDIVATIPEIRPGQHRRYLYAQFISQFLKLSRELKNPDHRDEFFQLAYRCSMQYLREGFDPLHYVCFSILLAADQNGDEDLAVEMAFKGLDIKAEAGTRDYSKEMIEFILSKAKQGHKFKKRQFALLRRRIEEKEEGAEKTRLLRKLDKIESAR